MNKYMARAANPSKGNHVIPYGSMLTLMYAYFKVPLGVGKKVKKWIYFTEKHFRTMSLREATMFQEKQPDHSVDQ